MIDTARVRALLGRLVAHDTTSSRSNRALIDDVANLVDRPGVMVEVIEAADDKASLIARRGPATDENRRGLVLCGHTDVVPATEPEWSSDPFVMVERGGSCYGRGTADMKGFLALAVETFLGADDSQLTAPLALLFTHDEEVGTLGARFLVEEHAERLRTLPAATLIGEPTELVATRLHKGHLKLRIEIAGKSAHSAYPHLGHNAIEPLGELIRALADHRRELEARRLPSSAHFPEVPFAALNLARVEGGVAVNIIPDRSALELGLRLLPGMDSEVEAAAICALARATLAGEHLRCAVLSTSPPFESPRGNALLETLRALQGQESEDDSVSFATDAGWLQQLGFECVLWGPGSIRVAHRPDELIPISDLAAAQPVIDGAVRTLCMS